VSTHPLEEVLHPRGIAIVGASNNTMQGPGFLSSLQDFGYKGQIYPVNPKYTEIMGMRAYPTVKDVPGVVDYVISSIPASRVLGMLEDCQQKGVKVVHLFTARFSETGRPEAAELEQEILRQAKNGGIRLIGPNCMGVYYPGEGITFSSALPRESGSVGLASQSGSAIHEIVDLAAQRGLRFSKAISYGNALDFNECDYLEYFAQDPETKMIMMYIEGVRDGKRFFNSLHKVAMEKPVIIVKGGRGASGTRATASHTASLAGSMEVWQTVVDQAGAVSAGELEELVDLATAFHYLPPITGRRVGVTGGSGGSSVLAADQCEEAGLDVVELPTEIRAELKAKSSPVWDWIGNPADFSIAWDGFSIGETTRMMAEHDNFDLLIIFMGGPWIGGSRGGQKFSIDAYLDQYKLQEISRKPLLIVLQERGPGVDNATRKIMNEIRMKLITENIPIYPNIGRAARTASKVIDYYRRRSKAKSV